MNILECANAELSGVLDEQFVAARNNLCHPAVKGDSISDDEVWLDPSHTVLKTPIECGENAYIYNGYSMIGAKSADKIYVSTGSLKTAGRAHATNNFVLDECDFSISPETWLLINGNVAYDLREVGGLVISNGTDISFVDGERVTCREKAYAKKLARTRKALKFYAEFCVNTILDLGGNPSEVYDIVADNSAFLYSGATVCHTSFEQQSKAEFEKLIDDMAFIPNIITSALQLLEGDIDTPIRTRPLKGKMIWGVKTHIVNLALSVLGYPATFERE